MNVCLVLVFHYPETLMGQLMTKNLLYSCTENSLCSVAFIEPPNIYLKIWSQGHWTESSGIFGFRMVYKPASSLEKLEQQNTERFVICEIVTFTFVMQLRHLSLYTLEPWMSQWHFMYMRYIYITKCFPGNASSRHSHSLSGTGRAPSRGCLGKWRKDFLATCLLQPKTFEAQGHFHPSILFEMHRRNFCPGWEV